MLSGPNEVDGSFDIVGSVRLAAESILSVKLKENNLNVTKIQ